MLIFIGSLQKHKIVFRSENMYVENTGTSIIVQWGAGCGISDRFLLLAKSKVTEIIQEEENLW